MKITLIALAAAAALTSGAAPAGTNAVAASFDGAFVAVQYRAEERAATIDEREARINARIERGLRDGRITNREARHLYRELRDIRAKEHAFRTNNGRIGPREFDELNRDLDQLADNVRHQLRDEQRY
jgi:hypothetical protein